MEGAGVVPVSRKTAKHHTYSAAFGEGMADRLHRRASGGLIISKIDQQDLGRTKARVPLSLSGDECIPNGDFRRLGRC